MCINRLLRSAACLIAVIAALSTLSTSSLAESGLPNAEASSSDATGEISAQAVKLDDPEELRAFIDPIFADHMDEFAIPGAAFVMVKDGEILSSSGYGVIEEGSDTPVDPERTIFDLGSIGKLFTTTGVMQQIERGELDLDTDVNQYPTEVEVPDTYDEPITLRHLLTHTAGFDDRMFVGMVATGPDDIQPLADNLSEHMPPRVRPPGQVNQYSNAGMTLAGHLIEAVSGERFGDYIASNIFDTLGMDRTTYDYPAGLVPDMATGHEALPNPATPMETWHLNQRPAGGIRSTATDMAAFMIAHLNQGEYDGTRILEPKSVEQMHATAFQMHEGVSGSALGFIEHQVGDRRGLQHGGQWVGFSSLLYLLPDEETGIFVSYNHGAGIYAQVELLEAILGRYFPAEDPDSTDAEISSASRLDGTYRWNRMDRHSFMQLPSMLTAHTLEVQSHDDGTISTTMSPSLIPKSTWEPVEPGVYQQIDGHNRLAFELNGDEGASAAYVAWPLLMTMDRVPWYQSAALNLGLLILMIGVILTTGGWPIARLYRRMRGREFEITPNHRRARLFAGIVAGLIVMFLVGTLILVSADAVLLLQVPTLFKALLWLPIAAAVLTIPLLVFVIRVWRNDEATSARRVHLSAVALAAVGLIPYLYIWGLLGFHY